MAVVAIIWAIIWFGLLGMDSETLPVPLGLGILTYWLIGKGIPSMWTGFISSFSGIGFSIGGVALWIGLVVLGLLGIVALFFLGKFLKEIFLRIYEGIIAWYRSRRRPQPAPAVAAPVQPIISVSPSQFAYRLGPNELYHGTSHAAARDIFTRRRWKSNMNGYVFMTKEFEYAADMAQRTEAPGDGAVLVVHHDPLLELYTEDDSVYVFSLIHQYGSWEHDKYYQIEGLTPIHILDIYGNVKV